MSADIFEEKKPVNALMGEVIQTSPLTVKVEQKLILTERMLVVPKSLTDFEIGAECGDEHFTLKLYNALKTGDRVLLLRMQGGQKFIITDRLEEK